MKKYSLISFLMLLSLSVCLFSCSEDKEPESNATYDELPTAAKTFLHDYFYGYEVVSVEEEKDNDIIVYEVTLQDGYEVVFNSDGIWQQVDAPDGESLPTGFIPEPVMQYLNENYSGYGVNEINRTGEGYKVELVTELDLYFNEAGEFTGLGSMN